MVYIITIIPLYLALFAQFLLKYSGNVLYLIALVPLGLLVILRGDVGVDTPTYESIIRDYLDGDTASKFEKGFYWVVNIASIITHDEVVILRIFSIIIIMLLIFYLINSDKDEAFLLTAYVLPMSFFDLATNTIRFGISISLFLIALQCNWRNKNRYFILLCILSIFFHYSILFCIVIYLVATKVANLTRLLYLLLCSITVLIFILTYLSDYLLLKYLAYSEFSAPSNVSGVRYISILLLLMIGTLVSGLSIKIKKKQVILAAILLLLGLVLTNFSYAGLRVLYLSVFLYPFLDLAYHKSQSLKMNCSIRTIWFAAGFISFIFLMRGYFNESGTGIAPSLPYSFIFFNR